MKTFDEFLAKTLCSFNDDNPPVQTQQTSNAPWATQQGFLEKGFKGAETDVLNRPMEFFPDQTFVSPSSQTEASLTGMEQRANATSPLLSGMQNVIGDTLSGQYLQGGNPAYGAMVDRATRPMIDNFQNNIVPTINGGFSEAGRYGSGIARQGQLDRQADILTRNIGDVSANLAFQNYGNERAAMGQAAQMAPGAYDASFADLGKLGQVGQAREGFAGQELQDEINRFNFEQMEPQNRLGQYMGLVGGGYGGTSTTVSPVQRGNPLMQIAGLGSMGVGMANALGNPSFGLFPGMFK